MVRRVEQLDAEVGRPLLHRKGLVDHQVGRHERWKRTDVGFDRYVSLVDNGVGEPDRHSTTGEMTTRYGRFAVPQAMMRLRASVGSRVTPAR